MRPIRSRLTYANVISTIALFLVIGGGTAYAANSMLPKNSVGANQIKGGAVTPAKLSKASKASMTGAQGPAGAQGLVGATGPSGAPGEPGPATGPAGGALAGNYPDPVLATQAGIATGYSEATEIIGTSCTNYEDAEVTIDAPSAGSVHVTANVVLRNSHTTGKQDVVMIGIDEAPSICTSRPGDAALFSVPAGMPTYTEAETTLPTSRTFNVTPGPHTYYLNGIKEGSGSGVDGQFFFFAGLTAIFIPS